MAVMNQIAQLKNLLPGVKEGVGLDKFCTLGVGGKAKYFYEASSESDILNAAKIGKLFSLPIFVLGGGSNVIFKDNGFNGLVIVLRNRHVDIQEKKGSVILNIGAGSNLSYLVKLAQKKNLRGSEWCVGIPGTIGGAIFGNAGAFKESMADIVEEVIALDLQKMDIVIIKNKDCQFSNRESIFKIDRKFIILSAKIILKRGDKKKISEKIKKCLSYRNETQPHGLPSAGCTFKNPEGDYAGALIEKAGLKGKIIGGARISQVHANFIENFKRATAKDILKLIDLCQKAVKKKFKIDLDLENIIAK